MENKADPLHILVVDDCKNFIDSAKSASVSFHMVVETCESREQALKLIQNNHFGAVIINPQLKNGSGIELINEARKQKDLLLVAVIDEEGNPTRSFRQLKEEYAVDYVLDKPLYRGRIEKVYKVIWNKEKNKGLIRGDDKEQELKARYKSTVCDKIELLSGLIKRVRNLDDEQALTALKDAVHKIGGSSGAYGFCQASKICKELDYEIIKKLDPKKKEVKYKWLPNLDHFLKSIKFYLQFTDDDFGVRSDKEYRNTLFVVDSNEKFLSLLHKEKHHYSMKLITESNPLRARERLLASDFNPRAVLIADNFPGFKEKGIDIINSTKLKANFMPTIFGISMDKESIDMRINATREGISHIFTKPISPHTIFEAFSKRLKGSTVENVRVLILDDDIDSCLFMSHAMSEVGINSQYIQTPERLYHTLEEYMPHLLLLDIILPKYNGISLLQTLRADPIYSSIDVVIVSSFTEPSVREEAYRGNVISILDKPLNKEDFQCQIIELAKHRGFSNATNPLHKRIGLKTIGDLETTLEECLLSGSAAGKKLTLIEVERFEDFILEIGRLNANKFLASLSNILSSMADKNFKSYFLGSSRFAILTERMTSESIEKKIQNLLLEAKSRTKSNINFIAGILPITENFRTVKDVLKSARESLESAEQIITSTPAKVNTCGSDQKEKTKKEIFLIDPDSSLTSIVKYALEQYHLKVLVFSSGNEALEAFTERKNDLPKMIIAERNLPDMDGLDLLDKFRAHSPLEVPFCFLTNYISDQDTAVGLKHGAVDYIAKPFNLKILTQKVLSEVFGNTPAR